MYHTFHLSTVALVIIGIAGFLALAATATFIGLYITKGTHEYTPLFEQAPSNIADALQCPNDPDRWWAASGGPTAKCIFSGNRMIGSRAVSEAKIQAKCASMAGCAGYMKRSVGSYREVTNCEAPYTSGLTNPYNHGQPEYFLYGHDAISTSSDVTAVTQGVNHEVVTVTMRRNV